VKLRFGATTTAGNRPGPNEDHIGWNEADGLWVIADGMGGHAAGEVASRITVDTTLQWAPQHTLGDSLQRAHAAVLAAARADERLAGMGSTVVALRSRDGVAQIGWVGDSRCYLWRAGKLRRLTRDHSLMQALSDRLGDDADIGDQRILLQAIGRDEPRPEVVVQPVKVGDVFLLATDGLTSSVSDAEISAALGTRDDPEHVVDKLLTAALAHGGGDNVSIIVLQAAGRWHERRHWRMLLAAAGTLLLGAALWWLSLL
jgi:protein phosphatase